MTDKAEELAHANELAMLIVDNLPNPSAFEWEHLMAAGRAILAAGWRPPLPADPDPHWEISTRVPLSVPVAERQELFELVARVVQAWETPDREAEVCGHRADHLWTENRRLRDEIGKLDRQIAAASPPPVRPSREQLGRAACDIAMAWSRERDDRPGAVATWETLDVDLRELHMRIGEGLFEMGRKASPLPDSEQKPVPYAEHERVVLEEIDSRDRATEWADKLAAALAPADVIGEHSNFNDPWKNALDWAESKPRPLPADEAERPRRCPATVPEGDLITEGRQCQQYEGHARYHTWYGDSGGYSYWANYCPALPADQPADEETR